MNTTFAAILAVVAAIFSVAYDAHQREDVAEAPE
jgi:hypothetical protein